jgi:hypothetical protein
MKKAMAAIIVLLLLVIAAGGGWYYMQQKKQPQIDAERLKERIVEASDLTTARTYYTGIVRFKEGSVPLIDKNGFAMKYDAVISAGFDLEKVDIDVTDEEVIVKVPKAEILGISIDPDSLEFYDNKFSLFKTDRKEATKQALVEAEKDAERNASEKGPIEEADKRAEVIFRGILSDGIGSRKVVVERI